MQLGEVAAVCFTVSSAHVVKRDLCVGVLMRTRLIACLWVDEGCMGCHLKGASGRIIYSQMNRI